MSKSVIVTRAKNEFENLCASCRNDFPTCKPDEGILEFGKGLGKDNVIACDEYRPKGGGTYWGRKCEITLTDRKQDIDSTGAPL